MDIDDVRQDIINRRENGKETYDEIGESYRIFGSLVQYIEKHSEYQPSKRIAKILKLDPSSKLKKTRERRDTLNKIAVYWKYKNWSDYETKTIEDFEKNLSDKIN